MKIINALITPFDEEGKIDYLEVDNLISLAKENCNDALVVCSTTGEGTLLTQDEKIECFKYVLSKSNLPCIYPINQMSLEAAKKEIDLVKELDFDTFLVVTPFYVKPTQEGLFLYFKELAKHVYPKKIILYNVPSRTGVNIEPATYAKLAEHPMIWGIKEAGGNISKIVETVALVGDKLDIYSGNDDQIVPIMACGGKGVISVLSNVVPGETSLMCKKCLAGDFAGAMEMQTKYLPLINALFCEVNPIPAKAAAAAMGFGENYVRLPLVPMEEAHEKVLLQCMRDVGVSV